MTAFLSQLWLVAAVLAAFIIGPGVAFVVLFWRKRQRRAKRRSPLGIDLLRAPGHTLREQLDEALNDLTFDLLTLSVLPITFLCLYLAQERVIGPVRAANFASIFGVATVIAIVLCVAKMARTAETLDRMRTGYDAEVAVGQALDQLMRQGAFVFHDFPAEGFNIDHVVLLDRGIFAIETKGVSKSGGKGGRSAATVMFDGQQLLFPGWSTKSPIDQAQRQAQWLGAWASKAIGEAVKVNAVIALPGWYVERKGRGDVLVLSGGELGSLLQARSLQKLRGELVQRVAHQVDNRCRTVLPTFKRTG